eukprot:maker-scaffold_6-snap-gene-6.14-mRNA-1 protein AED:0.00 eAED:0.00 QI:175/1/1/1/1/1/2/55/387
MLGEKNRKVDVPVKVEHEEEKTEKKVLQKVGVIALAFILGLVVILALILTTGAKSTENSVEYEDEYEVAVDPEVDYLTNLCQTIVAGEKYKANETDYITLIFDEVPTTEACVTFLSASRKLSKIVEGTHNNFAGFLNANDWPFRYVCGMESVSNPIIFERATIPENLTIVILFQRFENVFYPFTPAAHCLISPNTWLPIVGVMIYEEEDIEFWHSVNLLKDVALHDMMQVLGFGTHWRPWTVADGSHETENNFLQDAIYPFTVILDTSESHPENEPKYIGQYGVEAYAELTGENETYIPLQGAYYLGVEIFNISAGEGLGQVDFHFHEDLNNEIMTVMMVENSPGALSVLSLACLKDLGYEVDMSLADPYELPETQEKTEKTTIRRK